MAITLLSNTSSGAPALNGAVGSLIGVLDFCLVTTLGWAKVYSGTNVAAYRAPAGNRMYLGVDDTTTLNARVRGFETMTQAGVSVAAGTGPFPTDVQLSGGGYIYKSSDTTTQREWRFASDGLMFHLSISASNYPALFSFGDIVSYKASDSYGTVISAEHAINAYAAGALVGSAASYSPSAAFAFARSYTQLGGAVAASRVMDLAYGGSIGSTLGAIGSAYPSPVEGGLLLSRIRAGESAVPTIRGYLPGLWAPCHVRPLAHGDTFAGAGDLAGRSFVVWNVTSAGQVMIETSDTWRT